MVKLQEFTKEELLKSYEEGNTDINLMIEYIINATKTCNALMDKCEELENKLKLLENK